MKKFFLIIGAMAVTFSVTAQNHRLQRFHHGNSEPTVYIISVSETDTISCTPQGCNMQDLAMKNASVKAAIKDHKNATRDGFQQASTPSAIFADKRNTFSFAIGGDVALRAAYSFDRTVNNIDMVPYNVPMTLTPADKQEIRMDATTSRLFLRGIANTTKLGQVHVFMDFDFRGGAAGSYTPRIRSGYVQMLGLTVGRDVTTFCDLTAAPTTIDFQGPNAYNFRFATMIRYEHSFLDNHLLAGVAAEMPSVSGTYGETLSAIPQRVPDFPIYLQYAWGENRDSHIRASAVFRDIYLYNKAQNGEDDLFGWGVQLSGNIHITKYLELFMNGIYGEGITRYINDLMGSGLDFTPRPDDHSRVQVTPMFGWQIAAQINILPNLFVSGGYSAVTVRKKNGIYSEDMYKQGQYIFGNVFYNLTPRFALAAEYLYAHRKNMDGLKAHSNRINILAKYSF
ncbi:MAG: porin [Alistipes sp.]|nr:porin [Alistipes sp.]